MVSPEEVHGLRERAKELRCLYRVGSATGQRDETPATVFAAVLEAIPDGWQRPSSTRARIRYLGRSYASEGYVDRAGGIEVPLTAFGSTVGSVAVVDLEFEGDDAWLDEEHELLRCIAGRLGEYLEWKQQELSTGRIGGRADHDGWRARFVEALAARIDAARFGVEEMYLFGSVEVGGAGPESDIDLWVVCRGDEAQRAALGVWLDGWGQCLAEVAHQHTGSRIRRGLLDVTISEEAPSATQRSLMRRLVVGGAG